MKEGTSPAQYVYINISRRNWINVWDVAGWEKNHFGLSTDTHFAYLTLICLVFYTLMLLYRSLVGFCYLLFCFKLCPHVSCFICSLCLSLPPFLLLTCVLSVNHPLFKSLSPTRPCVPVSPCHIFLPCVSVFSFLTPCVVPGLYWFAFALGCQLGCLLLRQFGDFCGQLYLPACVSCVWLPFV